MLRRTLLIVSWLALALVAQAEESWLGIYIQGAKIGYASTSTVDATLDGKKVKRTDSLNVLAGQMLGTNFDMRLESQSWVSLQGKPIKMRFLNVSAGRKQTIDATFHNKKIVVGVNNNGTKTSKTLDVPDGAFVVDDSTAAVLALRTAPAGREKVLYVLDPVTVSLVKNSAVYRGKQKVRLGKAEFTADLLEVIDPRATTRIFLSGKGDLIKIEGPLGMEMLPETRAKAMKLGESDGSGPDLAFATMIKLSKPIENAGTASSITYLVSGIDLARMPSDAHQAVVKDGVRWKITVHPVHPKSTDIQIKDAGNQKPEWTKPDLHIPSDAARFKKLATEIVGDANTVHDAMNLVRSYVHRELRGDASIAMLRDANEVLDTKVGLCRDYAILTVTLLRAAGVPTRLVSGLVYDNGSFFYHAWAEAWDGAGWIGVDTTRSAERVTATHIKIAQGTLAETFMFFVLDGAKLDVVEVK